MSGTLTDASAAVVDRLRRRREHAHAEGQAEVGELRADAAEADHAERRAAQLAADEGRERAVRARRLGVAADAAAEVDHDGDDPLGDRGDEARARLRHQDAVRARRGDVDGADVDRAADEREQLGKLAKERFGRGGLPVGDERVAAARRGDELGQRELARRVVEADRRRSRASACVALAPK